MGIASVYMALGAAGRTAAEKGTPLREAWRDFRGSHGFDEVEAMISITEAKEVFTENYRSVKKKKDTTSK